MQRCGTASVVLRYLVSTLRSLVTTAVAVALMQRMRCAALKCVVGL
jgi:spore maturation protein SpmA